MSMTFTVYVGPYAKVTGLNRRDDVFGRFCDTLTCGRGEEGVSDDARYLVLNVSLAHYGCGDRKMHFSRYNGVPIVPIAEDQAGNELGAMRVLAAEFRAQVEAKGGTVEFEWGIVCGVS